MSPPTLPLLIHLVRNSPLPLSKLPSPTERRTRTINKVLGIAQDKDENRVIATTPLQRVSTLSREKKKTSPNFSTSTAIKRDITRTTVPRIRRKNQKTSIGLDNLKSMTGAGEEALEHIPCIHYPVQFKDTNEAQIQALVNSGSELNIIHLTFVK